MILAMLRLKPADWGVLALFFFELSAFLFSEYRANSASTLEAVAVAVMVYFASRSMIKQPVQAAWAGGLLGLAVAWTAFSGIRQFAANTEPLAKVGLVDFVAFRSSLISPIEGWVPGECFTVFLLALPFACGGVAYLWGSVSPQGKIWKTAAAILPVALLAAVLCLSLSRAVFWSTILFFVAACGLMAAYSVVTLRTSSRLLAGTLGGLLVLMVCETALYPGIFKAYAGSHASQMRSTQGRLNIWTRSLEITRGHRLWGIGSANTGLFLASSADQEETTGFASRAFSLPIQVLVEKGIVGFALYAAFLSFVGLEFHRGMHSEPLAETRRATVGRNKRNQRRNLEQMRQQSEKAREAMNCCFAAGLLAVLFRELTYSSLLEHTLTLAMTFTLAAFLCADYRSLAG